MEITTKSVDGVAVVQLKGRFDAHEVPSVRRSLGDVMQEAKGKLVVDLSHVAFIDSSGLASLVQGMKHCREVGGDLYLCDLAQPVRIIFELTRLDKAFEIFGGENEAIQGFSI